MVTQQEFLVEVESAWNDLQTVQAQCGELRLQQAGVGGGAWSVRDVLAHITWYEREMLGVLQQRALAGSDLWNLPQDERNRIIYEQNKDRSLADVWAESTRVHAELYALLEGLSEADLTQAASFQGMPPTWVPAEVLAGNTYEHYRAHAEVIRAWLDSTLPTSISS
jgi:uncharacterized damage-inducible protein DinB